MKGTGKRILSVSLSVLMALGMPSGTFAASPDGEVMEQESEAGSPVSEPETTQEASQAVTEDTKPEEVTAEPAKEEKKQEEKNAAEVKVEEPQTEAAEKKQEKENEESAENTKDNTGNPAEKSEKNIPDIKVVKTELIETAEEYLVTVYTDSDIYDQLYVGKKEDTEKKPIIEGKKDLQGNYTFQFAVSEEKLGSKLQIVPGVKESGEWYTKEDVYCQVPEKSVKDVEKTEVKPQADETEKDGKTEVRTADDNTVVENGINTVYASDTANGDNAGKEYKMFKIAKSTAKLNGDQIDITIYVQPAGSGKFTYDALYIGRWDDETKEPLVMGEVDTENNLEKFSFSVPASKNGQEVIFVPRNGSTKKFSGSKIALKLPTLSSKTPDVTPQPTTTPDPTATPEPTATPDPTVPSVSDTTKAKVIKNDSTEFAMFKVSEFDANVTGTKITLTIKTANPSFDKLYLGSNSDLNKTPVIAGTQADGVWTFQFNVDKSQSGKVVPVVLGKPDGTWYSKQQLYLIIPAVAGGSDEDKELADAGVTVEQGGTALTLKNFIVESSSAKLSGGQVTVTFTVSGTTYDRIYLGKKDDSTKEPVVKGVQKDGKTTFTFSVPEDQQGIYMPITPGTTNGTWLTSGRNLFIKIPNLGKTFDAEKYPNGVYDFYGNAHTDNSSINIESDSTITVNGDVVTVTIYSGSTSYDKIYIGSVNDSDAVKDANAVEGKELGDSDTERSEYRVYTFNLKKSQLGTKIPFVLHYCKGNGKWLTKQDYLEIPQFMTKIGEVPADLTYRKANITNSAKDFTINADRSYYMVTSGALGRVVIATDSAEYNRLYFGTREDINQAIKSGNGGNYLSLWKLTNGSYGYIWDGFTSEITDKTISYVLYSTKTGKWSEGTYQMTIPSVENMTEGCSDVGEGESQVERSDDPYTDAKAPDVNPTPTDTPTPAPSNVPKDGIYSTTAETGAAMFKVVNTKLTVKNGKMTALITLSGIGYDYLYMGTAAEAASHRNQWIGVTGSEQYTLDGVTKTGSTYEIPVSALDKAISVAAYSHKNEIWYDRTITFSSKDLKKIGNISTGDSGNSGSSTGGNTGNTGSSTGSNTTGTKTDTKPDTESKYESDTSGSTKKVDSKTKLKDGVYKPDKFTWSGGSGRVSISCDKVTIKNGQALATIVFSSSSYQYVKANGNKYLPSHSGGKSIFVIPVELNKNNTIIGMTTKMTAAHEITYSIMVYLAAAANADGSGSVDGSTGLNFGSNEKLDEKAPDIIGLEYKSETKLDYAKYFKIYHYDQDVTLLEIDMTKDTDNDPEKLKEETKDTDSDKKGKTKENKKDNKKDKKKQTTSKNTTDSKTAKDQTVTYSDEGEAIVQTQEEITADLYKANVVKYLIVPEDSDVELPVGIEKEMIVVKLPIKHAYVDSEDSISTMEDLKLLKKIKAVGFDQDETDLDVVNEGLEDESMVYAGAADDLKFRELVKNKIDFAIVSSEILPGSETEKAVKEKEDTTDGKKKDKNQKKSDTAVKDSKSTETDKKDTTDTADTADSADAEETTLLDTLADNFATLNVPLLVDRSSDEKSELAKAEWLKVYGAFFGCSDKTDKLYAKAVKEAKKSVTQTSQK